MPETIREMIDLCLVGNGPAWTRFVSKFHRLISGTCARFVPNSEVNDTAQLVYLKITENNYQLLRKFQGDHLGAFIIYLNEIAKNVSMSKTRSLRRKDFREGLPLDLSIDILDERPGHDEIYFEIEEKQEFYDLLEGLDEPSREILILRTKGYKFKEIAEILKEPLGTVLARANRAKEKLKKFVGNEIKS
ncbi:MAG: sigma-70 family RNA polymerase sigma factor [Leptospira sp.]|nr:sigma-70 family RNA polymerase sigma factor [Leptospira sp.]